MDVSVDKPTLKSCLEERDGQTDKEGSQRGDTFVNVLVSPIANPHPQGPLIQPCFSLLVCENLAGPCPSLGACPQDTRVC